MQDKKEHQRKYYKEYRKTEKNKAYQRNWRQKNKDKIVAFRIKWKKDNPEKWKASIKKYQTKYRARCRANNYVTKSTPKFGLRFKVFMRDNFTCRYCGRNVREDKVKLELDHVMPKSLGGKDTMDNYFTSCKECNIGKLNKVITKEKLDILNK